jgi:hypothetical protein
LAGKIKAACEYSQDGHENVFDQRVDDVSESGPDDQAHCQIDHIAAENELLEFLEKFTHWRTWGQGAGADSFNSVMYHPLG